jgi:predicted XRE-type DNA-binding protein
VFEVVEDHDGETYRAVYTVRFEEVVYVLHAFQKKSPKGIKTARLDIDLVERRLRAAQQDHEVRYGNRNADAMSEDETITRGSGNVFADLGYADAEERQTKLRLAHAINSIVEAQGLTQAAAAARLGINQPKVSALARYKLDGFSVERLMTFLIALGRDVEIVIKKKPRSRQAARISVIAA